MSYIGKIQRSNSDNYLSRLITKTRRDDADLIARHGILSAAAADSARLLSALLQHWPEGHFDEVNVAVSAPRSPALMATLGFIDPKVRRVAGWPQLSRENQRDFLRWGLGVAGREIGGVRLERDPFGWCDVTGGRR
jgi:hypothetical protein